MGATGICVKHRIFSKFLVKRLKKIKKKSSISVHYPRELVHTISTDSDQNYRTSRLLYEQRLLVFCPKIQNPSSFSTGPIPEIMCAKFRNQNCKTSMKH